MNSVAAIFCSILPVRLLLDLFTVIVYILILEIKKEDHDQSKLKVSLKLIYEVFIILFVHNYLIAKFYKITTIDVFLLIYYNYLH